MIMNHIQQFLLGSTVFITCLTNVYAVSTFGTKATGSDLEPVSAFLSDGGEGATSAAVSFTTFRSQASFGAASTYLPILRAESTGVEALFDDDRTQAEAQAYQVFTSSITQTIDLNIVLDSVVTNAPNGTSGVLSNIYVIGGPGFTIQNGFCNGGRFTFDSIYLCGNNIASSSRGLSFSNLFNDGSSPMLTDILSFDVNAGESFGIYAELSAGSFMGTADAFNTLSMDFTVGTGGNLSAIAPQTIPSAVPIPAAAWLFGSGLLALLGLVRRTNK